jgi:hypothetical protein
MEVIMKRLMILVVVLFGLQFDLAAQDSKKRPREEELPTAVAAAAAFVAGGDEDDAEMPDLGTGVAQEISTQMLIEVLRDVEDGDKDGRRKELMRRLAYPMPYGGTILHVLALYPSVQEVKIIKDALVLAAFNNGFYVPTAVNAYLAITDDLMVYGSIGSRGVMTHKTALERALECQPANAELIALLTPFK